MPLKTYKITLKVISHNSKEELPDWGLGYGVLATQEVEYNVTDKKIPDVHLVTSLKEVANQLIDDTIEVHYEEV